MLAGERRDMTKRVKAVEDKVQFLMGVSPEYFSMPVSSRDFHVLLLIFVTEWLEHLISSYLRLAGSVFKAARIVRLHP